VVREEPDGRNGTHGDGEFVGGAAGGDIGDGGEGIEYSDTDRCDIGDRE
jgi:hypothetical protein